MTINATPSVAATADRATGAWRLDPARSSVEFHVRHFYGLMTVKGHFERYDGTLQLNGRPAVELVIDADSLDTKQAKRDEHLRSAEFFDGAKHPQIRFESDDVLREIDGELELEASALADHRKLGMTWSPLGILRAPSKLIVRGRLVRTEDQS